MEYILGKNYDEFICRHEKIKFYFDGMSAKFVVPRKNVDDGLIDIFNFDRVFFQLFLKDGVVFVLIKFNELKWVDVPFVVSGAVNLAPPQLSERYGVNIIRANALSGRVYVNRREALGLGLSKALFWAAYRQMKHPVENLQSRINKIHASFSSEEMARLSLGCVKC